MTQGVASNLSSLLGDKTLEAAYKTAASGRSSKACFVSGYTYIIHEVPTATSTNSYTSETELTSLAVATTDFSNEYK